MQNILKAWGSAVLFSVGACAAAEDLPIREQEPGTEVEQSTRALSVPFVDACSLPGKANALFIPYGGFDDADEGSTAALPMPFPFTFLGAAQTKYWVTSNGEIGFGNAPGGPMFGLRTCPIPDLSMAKPIIYAYSGDLISWNVCMAVSGTAPHRKLIVTWKDSSHYEAGSGSSFTFGAQISEGNNAVDLTVDDATMFGPPSAWNDLFIEGGMVGLGLQRGAAGVSFSCYAQTAPPGSSFHYQP